LSKQKKVSRQVESQTEKQWHTRCEALLLRYKQHADYMPDICFYSNCVMPRFILNVWLAAQYNSSSRSVAASIDLGGKIDTTF